MKKALAIGAAVILGTLFLIGLYAEPQRTGAAVISRDATSTAVTTSGGPGAPLTISHTAASGATLVVASVLVRDGTNVVTSATWRGAAMTKATSSKSATLGSEIWYIIPTTTPATGNVLITITANDNLRAYISSWFGTDTSSPLDDIDTRFGSASSITSYATTTNEQLIIDSLIHEGSNASTKGASQTYITSASTDEGVWNSGASYRIETTGATYAMSWTNGASDAYAHAVASFKATSGGGGGSPAVATEDVIIFD